MAQFTDLEYGSHPECVESLKGLEWPWPTDSPFSLPYRVGAMLWLDRHFGKDDPSNIIHLEEDAHNHFALCFEHVDAELKALSDQAGDVVVGDPNCGILKKQLIKRLSSRPFRMRFVRPGESADEKTYPEWLQGEVRYFQLFVDSDEEFWPVMYTTRADGTKITLP